MKFLTITIMVLVLVMLYLKSSESKPSKKTYGKDSSTTTSLQSSEQNSKQKSKGKSVSSKSKGSSKGKGKGQSKGIGKCKDDNGCPEGYICLPHSKGKAYKKCFKNINECESLPCMNNGTCVDEYKSYTCQCLPGYTGQNCETEIDECESNPCLNKGTCSDEVNSYTCQCIPRYTGNKCETDLYPCMSPRCVQNAECSNLLDGNYTCTCSPRPYTVSFELVASSVPVSMCSSNYPDNYNLNEITHWDITADNGKVIEVKFTDFATEKAYDFVYLHEGPVDDVERCTIYTGSIDQDSLKYEFYIYNDGGTYPYQLYIYYDAYLSQLLSQPYVSKTNRLSIVFESETFATFRGFCFTFTAINN